MTENERYAMLFVQRVWMAAERGSPVEMRDLAKELVAELNRMDELAGISVTETKEAQ
jgi:hypothetical protein